MSLNLKLLDSFKLTGRLSTNFACGLSQEDTIFIISELGLYIVSQKSNLNSTFPEYMCQKYFLKPSTFAICEQIDLDINSFFYELPKDALYESAARVDLSYNLAGSVETPVSIIYAQWSDSHLVDGIYSMLGVLTNIYSLEIYIKNASESNIITYKVVLNLSNEIIEKRRGSFVRTTKMPALQKMRELKKRVEYIAPATFEWSHTFTYEEKNCAVIFVGHFHGDISVWRIFGMQSHDKNTRCEFLLRYNTKMTNISALYWHKTNEFDGGLCLGDSDGKISVLQIKNLDKQECSVDNEVEFFQENDGMKVDKITVATFGNYTFLIAIKQCYLFIYGLDSAGQVFDFKIHSVNNFYVTGISHHNNKLRVLTFTGAFKEVQLSVHFNKIVIEEITIPVKYDFSGYRTQGFIETSNKILYAFILSPYRLKNAVQGKKFVNFCLFHDVNVNPLKVLLENKSGCLRTFWDCFETLRLTCLKEQRFPWLGLSSNLELDSLSLIQLKTLRLIAKLSETVFTVIKRVVSYEIKPYILLHYLVDIKLIMQRLAKLFKEKEEGRELTLFELRSIDLQVFFLKEMVISGILLKAQVGNTFVTEILHILAIANELKYPDMIQCSFCGEKLIGSMCLPPHADSRCAFTLMPIFLAPAFKCMLCNSLAHNEIQKESTPIFCPYCDYPMERVCLNEKIQDNMDNLEKVISENCVKSKCVSDCVIDSSETIQELYLDLEDTEITFANISDDEEVEGTDLKTLYFKLAHMKMDSTDRGVNFEGLSLGSSSSINL